MMTRRARASSSSTPRRRATTRVRAESTRNGRKNNTPSFSRLHPFAATAKAPVGSALDAAQARSNFVLDVKKFVEEADDDAMRLDLGPRAVW